MHISKRHFIAGSVNDINGFFNRATGAEIGDPDLSLRRQGLDAIKTK